MDLGSPSLVSNTVLVTPGSSRNIVNVGLGRGVLEPERWALAVLDRLRLREAMALNLSILSTF